MTSARRAAYGSSVLLPAPAMTREGRNASVDSLEMNGVVE
jgi:hypothetical protein